ncbi:MAG: hypothetical protein ABWY25_00525 [Paenisporosarcina sp.]
MADRLDQRKENDIIAADLVDGNLVLRRYDGTTITISSGFVTTSDSEAANESDATEVRNGDV